MNAVFSFSRWLMLVKIHWAQNRKMYLLAIPAIAGLMVAWYAFIMIVAPGKQVPLIIQYITYYTGLLLVGCLFASMIFSDLGEKGKAIQYMLLPASVLEKLICALFFAVFLFLVFYTIIFYLVDFSMVSLIHKNWQAHPEGHEAKGVSIHIGIVNILRNFGGEVQVGIPVFLLATLIIQSVFILGSVYFKRAAFIKTTVFLFIIGLIIFLLTGPLLEKIIPQTWHMNEFIEWAQYDGMLQSKVVRLPGWIQKVLFVLLWYSPPFVFWLITYIRLKEKEV